MSGIDTEIQLKASNVGIHIYLRKRGLCPSELATTSFRSDGVEEGMSGVSSTDY
jgi:hypothetical protein